MADQTEAKNAHRAALRAVELELKNAELAKKRLELKQFEIEMRCQEAHTREALADAEMRELELADTRRVEASVQAGDYRNKVLWFDSVVMPESTRTAINTLRVWHRQDPSCAIEVIINSPGGSVIDGMALFDELTALSVRGGGSHQLTTTVRGYAASMAATLLQAGDVRRMGPESFLMIHEASSMSYGKTSAIKDEVEFLQKIDDRNGDIFVARSGGKITKAQFKKIQQRKDSWIVSSEAVKYGFVDKIG